MIGSFLLAVYDRYPPASGEGEAYRSIGWLLILISIFAVRHLRKRLLIYIPVTYLLVIFLSISFAAPAFQLVNNSAEAKACRGASSYIQEMSNSGTTFNARLSILKRPETLTSEQVQIMIDATRAG